MKHVLAIDIAKNESYMLLVSSAGEVLIEPIKITHNLSDFMKIHNMISDLKISDLTIFMESTSTYHLTVERFFRNAKYKVQVINPILAKNNTRNLRNTKTDIEDCYNLADLFFKSSIKNNNISTDDLYADLNSYSRQLLSLEEGLTRVKNRYIQTVNLTFPEFDNCFKGKTLYGLTALNFIKEFKHADIIKNKRVDALGYNMARTNQRHLNHYLKKANIIKEYSLNSHPAVSVNSIENDNLVQLVELLLFMSEKVKDTKEKMISLAKKSSLFSNIHSIYGIGEFTTALILAELRDITRFDNVKQLNAICGLDPTIIQSGKSINYNGPISKRGNKYARKILFNAASNIITCSTRNQPNNEIYQYFRKKQSEGKHHYESIIACSTKLLRIMFSLCKNNSFFQ